MKLLPVHGDGLVLATGDITRGHLLYPLWARRPLGTVCLLCGQGFLGQLDLLLGPRPDVLSLCLRGFEVLDWVAIPRHDVGLMSAAQPGTGTRVNAIVVVKRILHAAMDAQIAKLP